MIILSNWEGMSLKKYCHELAKFSNQYLKNRYDCLFLTIHDKFKTLKCNSTCMPHHMQFFDFRKTPIIFQYCDQFMHACIFTV